MQKHVNLLHLVKSFPTNIFLQNLASIQKRTCPVKFAHLAEKSGKGSISNLSTKVKETPIRSRKLLGTAGVKHIASSPACLLLHFGAGVFKIYTPSGKTTDLKLDGPETVKAMGVSANGGTIGLIVEHEEVAYFVLSLRNDDGTYGEWNRSPKLTIRPSTIAISKAGLAVCISDQVANFWTSAKRGGVLSEFEWSTDISCIAFFENDDPSFAEADAVRRHPDRVGRILLGCSDLLEVAESGR